MSTSEIATVLAWHDALNSGDIDTLLSLSSDDIEMGGPKGATQGLQALRDWASTAGITLVPRRMYYYDGVLVVEQEATWTTDPEETRILASAFRVVHDQVISTFRHETLESALSATDLTEKDLVSDT
ncbi:nuclear transport factor 2 family protein [Rhodococcus opacus]|nr:nuclear transport factor 2 family protein [Rhodococcus opacus]RZK95930.1 MAG: nuclear transport factor 2 family protein [Rhodococcus sp. (in: high G+C Gram-positive bacteria)]